MDGVSGESECLAGVAELGLLEKDPRPWTGLRCADHDCSAKLVLLRRRIALKDHITGEDGNLCTRFRRVPVSNGFGMLYDLSCGL